MDSDDIAGEFLKARLQYHTKLVCRVNDLITRALGRYEKRLNTQ